MAGWGRATLQRFMFANVVCSESDSPVLAWVNNSLFFAPHFVSCSLEYFNNLGVVY